MPNRTQLKRIPLVGPALAWLAAVRDARHTKQLAHAIQAQLAEQEAAFTRALEAAAAQAREREAAFTRALEAAAAQAREREAALRTEFAAALEAERAERTQKSSLPPAVYLALEERLRGPNTDVLSKLGAYSVYAEQVKPLGLPAVDLGCGRGELLQIFERAQLPAAGIDSSPTMVQECASKVLTAIQDDALDWLGRQPPASLGLVSAIHVVEHLPPGALWSLLTQAHRVLAPGGLLILETPNPENLQVASYSFWLDPTHRAPLPPPLLENLTQLAGFETQEVLRLSPYPSTPIASEDPTLALLHKLLYCGQDYAHVCFRPPS